MSPGSRPRRRQQDRRRTGRFPGASGAGLPQHQGRAWRGRRSFEHVVKLCHYFIDLQAHFRMMRDIRLKYFDPARMPASTMIQVGALTDEKAIYEVDVVAVLPPA
jgi:hypothetical protein